MPTPRERPHRGLRWWRKSRAISVFLGGLNFGLFYVGLGLGSGSMSAVAYQLATPFTVLLAWPLLAERPSLTTSAGVVLAFVGVVAFRARPDSVCVRD